MVNLYKTSVIKDDLITYIHTTDTAFKEYISQLSQLDKIIFHPYNITSYRFLKLILVKFPKVKVYWMCWSYELYNLPHLPDTLYEPFSAAYLNKKKLHQTGTVSTAKNFIKKALIKTGARKDHYSLLQHSYSLVHYFCSPFYSDFLFLQKIAPANNIQHLPIAYLSLHKILPDLNNFISQGDQIMIGHSASPEGNHYEVLQRLYLIDPRYQVFVPLAYGDKAYGNIIKKKAQDLFINIEVLEDKMPRHDYYKKLTDVGWAIINTKVQQGVGNIIALIWMGAKVFLNKDTSIYKDFLSWGIKVYDIETELNAFELSNKLSFEQVESNRKNILEHFSEEKINSGWKEFLY